MEKHLHESEVNKNFTTGEKSTNNKEKIDKQDCSKLETSIHPKHYLKIKRTWDS